MLNHWMKPVSVVVVLVFLALALPSLASAEAHGNLNFLLGLKRMSENDWEPVENQRELGILADWGSKSWPIHIATDFLISKDDEGSSGEDVDGKTWELAAGVRKVWYKHEHVRPYVGGGINLVHAKLEVEDSAGQVDDKDKGIGAWIGGGLYYRIGPVFQIGAALRYSYAKVDLFGEDVNAGGLHYGLLLGFGWPGDE
jgi:hypothetical protein